MTYYYLLLYNIRIYYYMRLLRYILFICIYYYVLHWEGIPTGSVSTKSRSHKGPKWIWFRKRLVRFAVEPFLPPEPMVDTSDVPF